MFCCASMGSHWAVLCGAWACPIAVGLGGCGGNTPFHTERVTGKVSYEDGSLIPAARVTVTFIPCTPPVDQKTHPRPATAEVNVTDGTFKEMTSWRYGDGATVGPNKVQVISLDEHHNQTDAVPRVYGDPKTTPLEVDVGSGSTHFELKIRKGPRGA